MWCESLQREILFVCILKHIKYYFGGFFGEWHIQRDVANGQFLFCIFTYFTIFPKLKHQDMYFLKILHVSSSPS